MARKTAKIVKRRTPPAAPAKPRRRRARSLLIDGLGGGFIYRRRYKGGPRRVAHDQVGKAWPLAKKRWPSLWFRW